MDLPRCLLPYAAVEHGDGRSGGWEEVNEPLMSCISTKVLGYHEWCVYLTPGHWLSVYAALPFAQVDLNGVETTDAQQ